MAEDFRVTATFTDASELGWLTERLRLHQVEEEARRRLGGRVSVSGEGERLFLYADSAAAAMEAERIVQSIMSERRLSARFSLDRWHPIEQQWEDSSRPLPQMAAERATEHERREAEEAAESQASGVADWEVRVELPSHHDAVALADRLQQSGQDPIRRWKYLLVGANTEDDARALAKSIESESPAAKVSVEASIGMVQQATAGTPFALFGPG